LPEVDPALLNVDSLVTGYSNKEVIKGVTLHVEPGEIVALLGVMGQASQQFSKRFSDCCQFGEEMFLSTIFVQ
jgi:ABC-type histidine transport system ATPase subunit